MDDIKFNLTQVAQMTMLTERTLHNYMKRGLLHGEKSTSGWQFTPEQISQFMDEPFVKAAIQSKHLSMVEDFLHHHVPTSGDVCLVYDMEPISSDLCEKLLHISYSYPLLRMAYYQEKSSARLTLCGKASQVTAFFAELQAAK